MSKAMNNCHASTEEYEGSYCFHSVQIIITEQQFFSSKEADFFTFYFSKTKAKENKILQSTQLQNSFVCPY